MSRLFEDSSDSSLLESQNHLLPSFSIWSMLLLRTSGLLLVGLILGLMVRRCHKLPLGRRQLWDILKCKQAESHMRARQVGQDYADGYDLWRAPTTSLLTSPSDEAVEPMETRVDQGPLEGLLRSPDSGITTLKELLLCATLRYGTILECSLTDTGLLMQARGGQEQGCACAWTEKVGQSAQGKESD